MRKVVIGEKKKPIPKNKLARRIDVETPYTPKPMTQNKKGERVADDFASLLDWNTFSIIKGDFEACYKQKSKRKVQEIIRRMTEDMQTLSKDFDEIGFGLGARQLRRSTIPSLNALLDEIDTIVPKEFFIRFKELENSFLKLNPNDINAQVEDRSFNEVKKIYKSLEPKQIKLSPKTPAFMTSIPISFFLGRKISDLTKVTLGKNLGVEFINYTGAMLYRKANFLVIDKSKFDLSNVSSVVSSVLDALFKDKNIVPIYKVSKNTDDYYAVLITDSKYLRVFMEIVEASKTIDIHCE